MENQNQEPLSDNFRKPGDEAEYFYTFQHPKCPGVDFGMQWLSQSNLEESLKLITDLFHTSEPKYVHLNIAWKDIHTMMKRVAERSIADGYGQICRDINTNKLVSVSLWTDPYNNAKDPLDLKILFPEDHPIRDIMGLWDGLKEPYQLKAAKREIVMDFAGTSPDYPGTYIGTTLGINIFAMNFFVPFKEGFGVYTIAGNRISSIASKRGNGVLVASVDLKGYTNKKGVKVFENIDDTCKKLKTLSFSKVELWKFDHESHVRPKL